MPSFFAFLLYHISLKISPILSKLSLLHASASQLSFKPSLITFDLLVVLLQAILLALPHFFIFGPLIGLDKAQGLFFFQVGHILLGSPALKLPIKPWIVRFASLVEPIEVILCVCHSPSMLDFSTFVVISPQPLDKYFCILAHW